MKSQMKRKCYFHLTSGPEVASPELCMCVCVCVCVYALGGYLRKSRIRLCTADLIWPLLNKLLMLMVVFITICFGLNRFA